MPECYNCAICGKEFYKSFFRLHIEDVHSISPQRYYHQYLSPGTIPNRCLKCGKELKFIKLSKPYGDFCSRSCRSSTVMSSLNKEWWTDPTYRELHSKLSSETMTKTLNRRWADPIQREEMIKNTRNGLIRVIKEENHVPYMTKGEFLIRDYLSNLGFNHSYPYWTKNKVQIKMDFFNKITKVNIEIDGTSHEKSETQEYDSYRDCILEEENVLIVRIKDEDCNYIKDIFR